MTWTVTVLVPSVPDAFLKVTVTVKSLALVLLAGLKAPAQLPDEVRFVVFEPAFTSIDLTTAPKAVFWAVVPAPPLRRSEYFMPVESPATGFAYWTRT